LDPRKVAKLTQGDKTPGTQKEGAEKIQVNRDPPRGKALHTEVWVIMLSERENIQKGASYYYHY